MTDTSSDSDSDVPLEPEPSPGTETADIMITDHSNEDLVSNEHGENGVSSSSSSTDQTLHESIEQTIKRLRQSDMEVKKKLEASEWITNVLENYLNRPAGEAGYPHATPPTAHSVKFKQYKKVKVLEHEVARIDNPSTACRDAVLSTMLTCKVKYLVSGFINSQR